MCESEVSIDELSEPCLPLPNRKRADAKELIECYSVIDNCSGRLTLNKNNMRVFE